MVTPPDIIKIQTRKSVVDILNDASKGSIEILRYNIHSIYFNFIIHLYDIPTQ